MIWAISAFSRIIYCGYGRSVQLGCPTDRHAGCRGNVWLCVGVATLGNWLGGLTSYWLGWLGKWEWIERFLHIKHETLVKHKSKIDRFGAWLALLTWLPFVGDVFALALGFYRVNFRSSALLMLVGKGARFVMWALLYLWSQPMLS